MAAAAAARTYADFVPPHNLVEEADKQTLVVDLSGSGFKKEHLRVQIDNYGRLRISGERQLEGNRWSRFRKELHVPDGCNAGDIRARFDKDGVFHITMPMLSPPAEVRPKAADAQQTTKAEEENKQQQEEEDGERKRSPAGQQERTAEEEGGRMDAAAASTARPTFTVVRDRRRMVRTLLLAVALAVVGAAGLYVRYWLMDPSAEPAVITSLPSLIIDDDTRAVSG